MNYKEHTRLDLVAGGNVFKQGDHMTLGFTPRDYEGDVVDLTGKNIEGVIYSRRKGIMFTAPAEYVTAEQKIEFTIDEVLDHGEFQIEFTVTDATDPEYRRKFPSAEQDGRLIIKPSADNMDVVGVQMTTVSQLKNELQGLQSDFESSIVPQVDELKQRVDDGVGAFTEDTEVLDARMGEPNLRAFNEKLSTQLAETSIEAKRKRELEDLSPNVLSAIEGGEGTSFNLLSIPQVGSVNAKRISNGQEGINLLDLTDIVSNFYVSEANGNALASASYSHSNYIKVKPNTVYGILSSNRIAFYDVNKVFISGAIARTFTSPSNAAYIRISLYNTSIFDSFLIEGSSEIPSNKIPYSISVPWLRIEKEQISSMPKLNVRDIEGAAVSANLYNKAVGKDGFYLSTVSPNMGREMASELYSLSDFIPVESLNDYTLSRVRHYVFFDENKLGLTAGQIDAASQTVTAPAGSSFIRLSISIANKDIAMLVKGSTTPSTYIPFSVKVPGLVISKSKYEGKVCVDFGDSITSAPNEITPDNYGSYITADTGIKTINQGYSSARAGFNSVPARAPFSMHRLADAIVSGDFTEQENALPNLDAAMINEYTIQLNKLKGIDFNAVDFVTLAYGTNDWFGSVSPIDNESDPLDVTNYYGAIRYSLKKMQEAFPHLKFLLMTPIFRFNVTNPHSAGAEVITEYSDTWTVNGYKLTDAVEALKIVGKELNVPTVDMYHELGVNKNNCLYWFEHLTTGSYDGTHPNARMKELMGRKVGGALLSKY